MPSEKERIKTQITEAEATIDREIDEFYRRHPKEAGDGSEQERSEERNINGTSKETVGEPRLESSSVPHAPVDTTTNNPSAQTTQSEQVTAEKRSLEEHNGEVLVEAEEDTVIY